MAEKLSVFVLIDALGWELVKDRPFLSDILPHRKELKTIFGFSSAAIPSILTGQLPSEHGHWNLYVYDPENSPFRWSLPLRFLPNSWANHRVVRKAVSIISRKMSRTKGYFQIYGVPVQILPLFDVCEKEDIYMPRGLRPSRSIFDLLDENKIPHKTYSYHEYTDLQAIDKVIDDLGGGGARFYFVYLSELDHFLHYNVQDPGKVEAELGRLETGIRRVYQAAITADPSASFYVFSDHGMTPVMETADVMGAVDKLGFAVPRDYVALYDATMARFWFFKDQARGKITQVLENLDCGAIVDDGEKKALGIDFGHNRFGDLVFLMKGGCLMHPSHMGRVPWPGMHGFHPREASSSASLLSRTEPPVKMNNIRKMFDLMCREAGIV